MPTPAEKVATAIDQVTDRIVEITASANPDYSVDGQSVSKGAYLEQLQRSLDQLKTLAQKLEGAWIVRSRGRP